jgi:CheY-like chemotaxis protein
VVAVILRAAGHDVVSFGTGRAALAAADATAFDLVLTDVLMPDMDGIEILRAFARRSPRPKLIVMTGSSNMLGMDFLAIAPALGADGVIAKPFRAKALAATVATTLAAACGGTVERPAAF